MEELGAAMILMLDTSSSLCRAYLIGESISYEAEWEAGRGLAKGLLGFLAETLSSQHKSWADVSGLGVMRGPGSFTGLRIGITVMNTLADANNIPIVGAMGEDWIQDARGRLNRGENDKIVLPEYGGEANITAPRK